MQNVPKQKMYHSIQANKIRYSRDSSRNALLQLLSTHIYLCAGVYLSRHQTKFNPHFGAQQTTPLIHVTHVLHIHTDKTHQATGTHTLEMCYTFRDYRKFICDWWSHHMHAHAALRDVYAARKHRAHKLRSR